MIASGDLDARIIGGTFRLSMFHLSMMAINKLLSHGWCALRSKLLLPYVTHVINFTRLPPFSACNIEKLREPGNEANTAGCLMD